MKQRIKLNHYPDDYVEEVLPEVIIEIRYRNHRDFSYDQASLLANEIKTFLSNWKPKQT